jgi:hypothetical protein
MESALPDRARRNRTRDNLGAGDSGKGAAEVEPGVVGASGANQSEVNVGEARVVIGKD